MIRSFSEASYAVFVIIWKYVKHESIDSKERVKWLFYVIPVTGRGKKCRYESWEKSQNTVLISQKSKPNSHNKNSETASRKRLRLL